MIAAFAAMALLAACGSPTPSPSPTVDTVTARLFWVADTGTDLRLFREDGVVRRSSEPGLTALRYLVSHQPADPDYTNLWPSGTTINSVVVRGDEATVDLAQPRLNVGSAGEALAIQQLLWTLLAAQPAVKSMRITVDGKAVESLAGHVDTTQPFVRPPAYEVVGLVWMLAPIDGAVLTGTSVTLSGIACTFEANVAWTITRDGAVVQSGSTLAAEACPRWSPWSVTVDGLAPGTYTASAAEYSAKDGSLVVEDTKRFTLR
jgi:hypothetical protein